MFRQIWTIGAIFAVLTSCNAHIGGQIAQQNIKNIKPQKYCGPMLSQALALLCYDENGKVGKRSEHNSIYNAILPPLYKEEKVAYWPWLSAQMDMNFQLPTRGKRFIVDECCFKDCDIEELISYC